jgi:hypothetical protein
MTSSNYVVLAYVVGLVLMWGFAIRSWIIRRSLARRMPPQS